MLTVIDGGGQRATDKVVVRENGSGITEIINQDALYCKRRQMGREYRRLLAESLDLNKEYARLLKQGDYAEANKAFKKYYQKAEEIQPCFDKFICLFD